MNIKKNLGKKILVFLFFALVIVVAFKLDWQGVMLASVLRFPYLDSFMMWITFAGSTVFILFFLTSLFLWHERKRKWIIPLWGSLLLSFIAVSLLKFFIPRERPYELGVDTMDFLKISNPFNSSFPSLHAASAFSALPVLDKEFRYFKFVWIFFAVLVAISRVYFALHYPSDVIIGALIGYSSGNLSIRLTEKNKKLLFFANKWLKRR
ncbi:MAG: phosphatase PAP2 family protein [archaeon]